MLYRRQLDWTVSVSWRLSSKRHLHFSLRGHPHGNAFVCKCTFCMVLADRPHGSYKRSACKHTFLKPGLRVEKSENAPLPLVSRVDSESAYSGYRWRHRPTPRPLAFDLLTPRCLITATTSTTTMADYMLVFMTQKIFGLLGLLGQKAKEDGGKKIVLVCVDMA